MAQEGKVALVTGASRGIGASIAVRLAEEACDVAVFDVLETDETVSKIEAAGRKGLSVTGDVTSAEDRAAALEKIRQTFGRLDVLVNNAGVAPKVRADILEAGEESYDRVMTINLKGPYFLTQAVANWMLEQQQREPDARRCIVNISSMSSYVASPSRGEYCISKAGVSMATKLFAARLAEDGIGVYEIQPGIIKTDMIAKVQQVYEDKIAGGLLPQRRMGEPADVARAVRAIADGLLDYCAGQVLHVDGGFHLRSL